MQSNVRYTLVKMAVILSSAVAGSACSRTHIAPFDELDKDSDGRISQQEATHDIVLAEVFADVDSDEDGELTAFEYLQAANRP